MYLFGKKIISPFAAVILVAIAGCTCFEEAEKVKLSVKHAAEGDVNQEKLDTDFSLLQGAHLDNMVNFALRMRPEVDLAELSVKDSRLVLRLLSADAPILASTNSLLDKFTVTLSGGHSESSSAVKGIDNLESSTEGNASSALSLDLLLWDFGRNDAAISAQIERVLASEKSLLEVKFSVFEEVSRSYFDFLESRALMEVAFTNRHEFAAHLEQTERRLEAGEVKKLDLLRAKLDMATAEEAVVAASNQVRVCVARLIASLGLDASNRKCEEMLYAPGDPLHEVTRCFPDSSETLATAFAFARTNAPSLCIKRAELRAAVADVDAAKADMLPSISASASLSWSDPLWVWRWGVNGVWTVFQGFRKKHNLERAVTRLQEAAAVVESAEIELSSALELALAQRDNARQARLSADESFRRARENLRHVSEMLRVGEADRVDFSSSAADYAQALGAKVSAFYNGQRAEASLFAVIGRFPRFKESKVKENGL